MKDLEEYYDLYIQIDTLFLAVIFENFRNMCHEIHDLDSAKLFLAPGLS